MSREKKRAKKQAAASVREDLRFTERYVPTSDDWHPSFMFDGKDYVSVTRDDDRTPNAPMFVWIYARLYRINDTFHLTVGAWGNDDTSMIYRASKMKERDDGEREFERWMKWLSGVVLVSMKSLEQVGFKFE